MRLISWNINGIRAWIRKMETRYGSLEKFLEDHRIDIACFQETKVSSFEDLVTDEKIAKLVFIDGYDSFWSFSRRRKGWSGVVTYAKKGITRDAWEEHLNISQLIKEKNDDDDDLNESRDAVSCHHLANLSDTIDYEGRIMVTDHARFRLFNVYFPNGGMGDARFQYKMAFYEAFKRHLENLIQKETTRPIIVCGDMNTAHKEIDVWNPKKCQSHTGFLPIERSWVDQMIGSAESSLFIDTFRQYHPEEENRFTYWDTVRHARSRNEGWRIDGFWLQRSCQSMMLSADIWSDIPGSDHCPVVLDLEEPSLSEPYQLYSSPKSSAHLVPCVAATLKNPSVNDKIDKTSGQLSMSMFFSRKRSSETMTTCCHQTIDERKINPIDESQTNSSETTNLSHSPKSKEPKKTLISYFQSQST